MNKENLELLAKLSNVLSIPIPKLLNKLEEEVEEE